MPLTSAHVIASAAPGETKIVDIEYEIGPGHFETYSETVSEARVTDGGVLLLLIDENRKVSAVSPTGWTRVSVR